MRLKRALGVAAVAALGSTISMSAVAAAADDSSNGVTQSFDVKVKPKKKLPKKQTKKKPGKGVKVKFDVGVTAPPGQKPPAAERVLIDMDKDVAIRTKGMKRCDPNSIATANSGDARDVCKKSIVGRGSATATCSGNPTPDIPDVTVTAFNGDKQGRNDVILLHTYASLGGTDQVQILPAVLKNAPGRKFGIRADIEVPPLAGGACSIVDFNVALKARFKKKGKKYDYITAACSDKRFEFTSEFQFVQPNAFGVDSLEPADEQKCKAKKRKRR